MKRAFVRILWGEFLDHNLSSRNSIEKEYGIKYNPECKIQNRRTKVEEDIKKCLERNFKVDFVTYVFGKENYEGLIRKGVQSVLIHDSPYKYSPVKGLYQHKLDAYQYIMKDYDEIVFLDWDTDLIKELPSDFWDVLGKKEIFQASLTNYRTPRLKHRIILKDNKATPTGAFVYMRDKSIPKRLIELNKMAPNQWSCETAYALLTDELMGGWKGIDIYWDKFEPDFYVASRSPYKFQKHRIKKNVCFKAGFDND